MLASFALLQGLFRQGRRELAVTLLPVSSTPSRRRVDDTANRDQADLERWLFDRDSRWDR